MARTCGGARGRCPVCGGRRVPSRGPRRRRPTLAGLDRASSVLRAALARVGARRAALIGEGRSPSPGRPSPAVEAGALCACPICDHAFPRREAEGGACCPVCGWIFW